MDHDDLKRFDTEQPESRSAQFADMEVSRDGWSFEGLLSVYDRDADLGDFTESFARGAYRKVLAQGHNVPMVYHHNDALPVLATTRSGTLALKDDAKGLHVKADIAQHYVGEAVRELVKRGDIAGMSPGFIAGQGNSRFEKRNGKTHRTIIGLKRLLDVSPTWDPAYVGTTAEMRSLRSSEMRQALLDDPDVLDALAELIGAKLVGETPIVEAPREAAPIIVNAETPAGPADEPADDKTSQSTEGGADPQTPVEATQDTHDTHQDADPGEGEQEQRSGVDEAKIEAEAAARSRRLKMMELTLPKDDRTWLVSDVAEQRAAAAPPVRSVDEVLSYPRETWSADELRVVAERQREVQSELFGLVSESERKGRNLTPEEGERYQQLEREFARLRR